MNDERNNSSADMDAGLNTENLCVAAMLRACADGELCPDQCDRLKQYLAEHPEAAGQVEFERALKGSCERVMGAGCGCPNSLRDKIEAMACECMAASGMASGIEASNERTRKASYWKLSPAMSSMAAVLVLAGGALIWQSSSVISSGGGFGAVQTTPVSYAERVGDFVAREHVRCCEETAAAAKLIHSDINEAAAYFSEKFNMPVATPDPDYGSSKIRFYGGGDCHVPATSGSGHLRFDAVGDDGEVVSLSLFVSPDPGLLGIQEGVTYLLDSAQCKKQGANLFAWVADGVMYLLVSEADEAMCAEVRSMMRAPMVLQQL